MLGEALNFVAVRDLGFRSLGLRTCGFRDSGLCLPDPGHGSEV